MSAAQQYDPTSPTPYQAPVLPDPTPAQPSPLPTQGPEINGAVKKSGAIATVADGILRGFMQGRAYHQASQVLKLKKKTDDLQNSYNQDAVRLYQLHAAGVDPNSDEYKAAKSSVDGSWGALMDFYKGHITPDDGKKKSKAKKVEGGIVGALTGGDPMTQSAAWFQVAQKMGPPVYGQIAMLNTPEAKANRQAQTINAQTNVTNATNNSTAAGQQGQQLTHQQAQLNAQQKIDDLNKTPQSQWTQPMWEQYNQAQQQIEPRKPGDEAKVAADAIIRKSEADPKYQFTDQDKEVLCGAGYKIDPHLKTQVTKTGEIIQFPEDGGPPEILRPSQAAYEPRGRSGGAGSGADKNYAKWDSYYKEHYPDMAQDERDALVRRKVEGANQEQSGSIAHDAIAEPKQFDNDVLSAAINNLRNLPQYKDKKDGSGNPFSVDDAILNLVYQDDSGYQYRKSGEGPKADGNGKFYYGMSDQDVKQLERDLQTQIRAVMSGSKETALSPQARRAAMSRMQPLFGPAAAPAGSTKTPESPQAGATPTGAPSSASPAGGQSQFTVGPKPKGMVEEGNLPIWNRPTTQNADGSHSSELSISMGDDKGREVLIPTIVGGKFLTPNGKMPPLVNGKVPPAEDWDKYPPWKALKKAAWDHFQKTGENLGKFDNPDDADAYAGKLHNRGSQSGGGDQPKPRQVYQHGKLHGSVTLTDAEVKQLADDPDFKAQGGTIK